MHTENPTNCITWRNENELFSGSDDNTIAYVDIRKLSGTTERKEKDPPWLIHRFDGNPDNLGWVKNLEIIDSQYIMSCSSVHSENDVMFLTEAWPSSIVLWDIVNMCYVQKLLEGCFIRMKYNQIRKQMYLASFGSLLMIDNWDVLPFLQHCEQPRAVNPCNYDFNRFGMPCVSSKTDDTKPLKKKIIFFEKISSNGDYLLSRGSTFKKLFELEQSAKSNDKYLCDIETGDSDDELVMSFLEDDSTAFTKTQVLQLQQKQFEMSLENLDLDEDSETIDTISVFDMRQLQSNFYAKLRQKWSDKMQDSKVSDEKEKGEKQLNYVWLSFEEMGIDIPSMGHVSSQLNPRNFMFEEFEDTHNGLSENVINTDIDCGDFNSDGYASDSQIDTSDGEEDIAAELARLTREDRELQTTLKDRVYYVEKSVGHLWWKINVLNKKLENRKIWEKNMWIGNEMRINNEIIKESAFDCSGNVIATPYGYGFRILRSATGNDILCDTHQNKNIVSSCQCKYKWENIHKGCVYTAQFSNVLPYLATGGQDGVVNVYMPSF
ncbi:hypothetical protein RFI_25393 [Reticulomyxa filosa]|uniref:Uncharacterized protein n=1 Tax=Reticulomyxa filosa TaxID=46433 RepID=X6MD89_RETFI|nr:hypothetical protein RFI_25393 [Reticulomyxa filosa]|eukprot:ETO11983.1 hypothetical protein RFI_25393 [Reticulomyxa filosa]